MNDHMRFALSAAAALALISGCAHHATHAEAVDRRGDQAMGFQHEKTAHHFLLMPDGGAITADAADPKDTESRDQIRMHFHHIAKAFAEGNFDMPMFVHDTVPPGVPVMKRLAAEIHYVEEDTDTGARVRISSANADAVAAIHDFLRFQIAEHRTGDPTGP